MKKIIAFFRRLFAKKNKTITSYQNHRPLGTITSYQNHRPLGGELL